MATTKITDLTAYTDPINTDVLPIVDVTSDVTKKVSIANVMKNASLGSAAAPGISFDGDPNTGIYSPGADQVAISTNGTGRLFINANGRVGIGGSTAAAPLQINDSSSNIYTLFDDGTNARYSFLADTSKATIATFTTGGAAFEDLELRSAQHIFSRSGSLESARIDSSGRVGIGTSSPAGTLNVQGSTAAPSLTYDTANIANFDAGTIQLALGVHNAAPFGAYLQGRDTGDGSRVISLNPVGGNVGIGTTSPSRNLTVSDTTANPFISIEGSNTSSPGLLFGDTDNNAIGQIRYDHSVDKMRFSANGAERATIDSSGRLGIGENSPDSTVTIKAAASTTPLRISGPSSEFVRVDSAGRLLVGTSSSSVATAAVFQGHSSSSAQDGRLFIQRGATALGANTRTGQIHFADSAGNIGSTIESWSDDAWAAGDYPGRLVFSTTADGASSPTERMRIDNAGNVGIAGTPQVTGIGGSDTLTFVGGAGAPRIYSAVSTGGSHIFANTTTGNIIVFRAGTTTVGSISVTASATAYNTSSDYRLKENVTPVTDGITRLQQLKPSRFNFIADPDKTVDGFLAHEVQTIVPEAITGEKDAVDDEGKPVYQGIDQSKLVPLLTAALQEAVAKIESLEARLIAAGL